MTDPTHKAADPADPADTFISDIENDLSIYSMIDSLERAETALRLSITLAKRAGAGALSANLREDQRLAFWHDAISLIAINAGLVSTHLKDAYALMRKLRSNYRP